MSKRAQPRVTSVTRDALTWLAEALVPGPGGLWPVHLRKLPARSAAAAGYRKANRHVHVVTIAAGVDRLSGGSTPPSGRDVSARVAVEKEEGP